jgi:hypothetical protein
MRTKFETFHIMCASLQVPTLFLITDKVWKRIFDSHMQHWFVVHGASNTPVISRVVSGLEALVRMQIVLLSTHGLTYLHFI